MRISGGTAKGRRTATVKLFKKSRYGNRLRPTSAKVREAVFDIIGNKIKDAVFVDLYAGTGTVGMEALSRGASKSFFVESDELRIKSIKKYVFNFGFQERATVVRGKAHKFLENAFVKKECFDIFFIDPPYNSEELEKVLPIISEKNLLSENGIVIVEHFLKNKIPEKVGNLEIYKCYKYGDTMLTLYRKVER